MRTDGVGSRKTTHAEDIGTPRKRCDSGARRSGRRDEREVWRRRFGRVDDLDESELAHDVQVVDPAGDPATEAGKVGALERPSNTARVDCFLRSDAVRARAYARVVPFTARLASDELATLPSLAPMVFWRR